MGDTLVSTPLDVSDVKQYFGDQTGFPGIDDLIELVGEGAPAPILHSEQNLKNFWRTATTEV